MNIYFRYVDLLGYYDSVVNVLYDLCVIMLMYDIIKYIDSIVINLKIIPMSIVHNVFVQDICELRESVYHGLLRTLYILLCF